MSGPVQVKIADGSRVTLVINHEYLIRTRIPTVERYDRLHRMGFIGTGPGKAQLQFSARGPNRTDRHPYAGTQVLESRWIKEIIEVSTDHAKRFVARRAYPVGDDRDK